MLNKNGWGIVEAILFLLVFIVCLLFSFWGLRRLGLVDENWQFYSSNLFNPNPDKNGDKQEEPKEPEKVFSYEDFNSFRIKSENV